MIAALQADIPFDQFQCILHALHMGALHVVGSLDPLADQSAANICAAPDGRGCVGAVMAEHVHRVVQIPFPGDADQTGGHVVVKRPLGVFDHNGYAVLPAV